MGVVAASAADDSPGAGDLQRANLSQAGRDLILTVRTASPVRLAKLDRLPAARGAGSPYLCLALSRAGRAGERRICLGGDGGGCQVSLPANGSRTYRLRPVRPVGCTGGDAGEFRYGPRNRRVVALTFDDGPSEYTESFLDVLRREHIHGNFFEIGQEMVGREDTMRRILGEGDEIGDHTMHHVEYPDYVEIAGAAAQIQADTHFEPCLFRPPGGAVDSSVVATVSQLLGHRLIYRPYG